MKMKVVDGMTNRPEVAFDYNDSDWQKAFSFSTKEAKAILYRATFTLPEGFDKGKVMLYLRTIGQNQNVYLNGKLIGENLNQKTDRYTFEPEASILKTGINVLAFVATPYFLEQTWSNPNTDPGVVQLILPAPQYKRSLFSGKAQVIVQSTSEEGTISLKAKSNGLATSVFTLNSKK